MRIVWVRRLIVAIELVVIMLIASMFISSPVLAQGGQALPPGLYITGLRMEPPQPTPNTPISFYATILNNSGPYSNFRWLIQIYTPSENRHPFGQTSADALFDIPVGTSEIKALGSWKTGPGDPCQYFSARVVWLDNSKKATTFLKTDGSPAEFPLTICASWPSAPPIAAPVLTATAPVPTATSKPSDVPTTLPSKLTDVDFSAQAIAYPSDWPPELRSFDLSKFSATALASQGVTNTPPSFMKVQLGHDPTQPLPVRCNLRGWVDLDGLRAYALTHEDVQALSLLSVGAKGVVAVNGLKAVAAQLGLTLGEASPFYFAFLLYNYVVTSSDENDCGIFIFVIPPITGQVAAQCPLGNYCRMQSPKPPPPTPCVAPPELFDPPTGRTFWARNTILRWRGYSLQSGETFAVFVWAENGAPQILTAGIDYNPKRGEYSLQVNDLYAWLPSKYTWAVRVTGPDGSFRSCETNTSWFTLLPPGQIDLKPGVAPPPPTNWTPPPGWCG